MKYKRVHFIAIGGSVMHNLALALHDNGIDVSGSDDNFYEPSKSRLDSKGLLPSQTGWDASRISEDLDAVILGMHAKKDNPELLKAQELGLTIHSFPSFIFEQSLNKQRVVIAGSHGKTTITAMILHVLKFLGRPFDYAVGAQLKGFDNMVRLSDAPIIIIEGDEYLSSPIDAKPKFLNYHHHVGMVSGISWDHYNVFPNKNVYAEQFDAFADKTPKAGTLIYNQEDDLATVICAKERADVTALPYKAHPYKIENGKTYLETEDKMIPVKIFGHHNMQNLACAKVLLNRIAVMDDVFYEAIQSFEGAAKRMELLAESSKTLVYKDYAHAPSKLSATVHALKNQYKDRQIVGCLELHTFSSLNKKFLHQYKNTFDLADHPYIYLNPQNLENKNLENVDEKEIRENFANDRIRVFTKIEDLRNELLSLDWDDKVLIMMSSGNFDGLDLEELAKTIIN